MFYFALFISILCSINCSKSDNTRPLISRTIDPPAPSCNPCSGNQQIETSEPELIAELGDSWHEAWLGSPMVVDLDNDGTMEIIAARNNLIIGWHLNGKIVFRAEASGGRIFCSPVVADLLPGTPGLEIAASVRSRIYVWNSVGNVVAGFPVEWIDELRSLAAGDIDNDGQYELVAVSTNGISANNQKDIIIAYNMDGSVVSGFPPNTTGAGGCDDKCYVTGGFDQNIAIGDVNNDGTDDIFATQDNAYLSLHEGDGTAFDAADIFSDKTKFLGIRFLHDYDLAQQGWANDEKTANQAHFTNSAPAITDVDGDGTNELVVLGSVQNAAQTDRKRGVALWVLNNDGTRPANWIEPFHALDYLSGLWDFEGTNIVGATNEVTVADIDPGRPGPEFIFAGFDGRIHAVDATNNEMWFAAYTNDPYVLTGGVIVTDLSGDGRPEIIFNTYSPDNGKCHLFILDSGGNEQHRISLPGRGAMPVPTIADVNDDGQLEIIVSLKDSESGQPQVLVYTVEGSCDNCLLWPTGRANYLRNGYVD